MDRILYVGIGGAVGSVLRYLVSGYVQDWTGSISFPFGTLVVNVLGCLVIGVLSQLGDDRGFLTPETRALLVIGVLEAKRRGLAGATVLRGIMGYGAASRISTTKIERLSQDLPVLVELVDTREKLEAFLEAIDPEIHDGMATLEKAFIRFYRSS